MDAIEAVAILILVVAIFILVYYYLLNSPSSMDKLKNIVPESADAHMDEVLGKNNVDSSYDLSKEDVLGDKEESESMGKRIKVKLSDIDGSTINTSAFSHKLDAFLDQKSDQLIKDWSLATTNDLDNLQAKFDETTNNVDTLEKNFNEFKQSSEEFQKITGERLDDLDKRIESLENK
ncbi:MAG: hypothetical protein MJ226_06200 [archaeon]|uniref:Uncharacterized protein n=1 Tax=Methanobrevibacter gottschalkii DSM 11977 TaxID=1122229 RepID=A0A3N5B5V0_9EURY|nr:MULTISPECIES: hypothetical protein [Methanobrevibacter]MCQ2971155.1 hypothetical protein [archaeon]OEC93953.1 hypothetical protein A9505_01235 [Methanobrevibacter sp. A27]RPF52713.1 hypothetical protein EDC42_0265 [Methanobrevibacter gottschalkii DSM 11977]